MHARKLLSLLLSALLAVTVLAGCAGRSDFSKEVVAAANNIQNTVTFKADSQLTRALQDALADNVQTSDVRDAMAADQSLQALLTDGYRLDVFAVSADSAKVAAESIAQNIAAITTGKKSEGKAAMVLADNGYYYAAVLTWRDRSNNDDNQSTPPKEPETPTPNYFNDHVINEFQNDIESCLDLGQDNKLNTALLDTVKSGAVDLRTTLLDALGAEAAGSIDFFSNLSSASIGQRAIGVYQLNAATDDEAIKEAIEVIRSTILGLPKNYRGNVSLMSYNGVYYLALDVTTEEAHKVISNYTANDINTDTYTEFIINMTAQLGASRGLGADFPSSDSMMQSAQKCLNEVSTLTEDNLEKFLYSERQNVTYDGKFENRIVFQGIPSPQEVINRCESEFESGKEFVNIGIVMAIDVTAPDGTMTKTNAVNTKILKSGYSYGSWASKIYDAGMECAAVAPNDTKFSVDGAFIQKGDQFFWLVDISCTWQKANNEVNL